MRCLTRSGPINNPSTSAAVRPIHVALFGRCVPHSCVSTTVVAESQLFRGRGKSAALGVADRADWGDKSPSSEKSKYRQSRATVLED